ncbi:MAG: HAMP domain-containing protein [Deltaproteobacteria bacterium]|nr:MAG: HAMP domain-containing protein [Deltaproteobacteria bacterium]
MVKDKEGGSQVMVDSEEKREVKFSLKLKFTFFISILIVIVGLALGWYFLGQARGILLDQLIKRAKSLTTNLASSAKFGVLAEDKATLNQLIDGLYIDEDVVYAVISDKRGETLVERFKGDESPAGIAEYARKALDSGELQLNSLTSPAGDMLYDVSVLVTFKKKEKQKKESGMEELFGFGEEWGVETQPPVPAEEEEVEEKIVKLGVVQVGFTQENVLREIDSIRRNGIWITLLIIGSGIALSLFLVRLIVKPLENMAAVAKRIAGGDLGHTVEARSSDEIGVLGQTFNHMTRVLSNNLQNLQTQIDRSNVLMEGTKKTIQQLSSSTTQIMAISTQQSRGATEQATAMQEVMTTSKEIAVSAKEIAEAAGSVEEIANKSLTACSEGETAVSDAIQGMARVKDQVNSIAKSMLELGEKSQRIGGVVDIIEEISEQTNLLALNASIEAAGAGEAGKRFSVVAEEVRRLAERTIEATRQINQLISEIQRSTNNAIMATEEGSRAGDEGVTLVDKVSDSLHNIIALSAQTTQSAKEIHLSTQQQTSSSEQMASTISEISDIAQQVVSSAKETEGAMSALNELTEKLKELVEQEERV